MTPTTVPTLLRKARSVIDRCGWHQGDLVADFNNWQHSPVCTYGALFVAMDADPARPARDTKAKLIDAAGEVLRRVLSKRGYSRPVADWNDYPARTREHVLALYDDALREVSP